MLRALLFAALALMLVSCTHYSGKTPPKIVEGALDARDWDLSKDGSRKPCGERWRKKVRASERENSVASSYYGIALSMRSRDSAVSATVCTCCRAPLGDSAIRLPNRIPRTI